MSLFVAFLLCALTALFTWYVTAERFDDQVSAFKKELDTLQNQLTQMSDERKELQDRVTQLDFTLRLYEHTLEGKSTNVHN